MTNDAAANPSPTGNPTGPHLSAETLSAYHDHGLRPNERQVADAHLRSCPRCRQDLADLRATVALLHALPERRPRRSFQLSPDQALPPAPWFRRWFIGLPAAQIAAAAVSVLLVLVIAGDLLTHEGDHRQVQMAVQTPSTINSAISSNAREADDVQPQLGAKPASTNPPAAISAAREAQPPGAAESGVQAPANSAARAPAPANAESAGGAADQETASSPAASPTVAPTATAAPAPTAQPTEVASSQSTGETHPSWWRISEIALAILLLWLIVSAIGLRRIRP